MDSYDYTQNDEDRCESCGGVMVEMGYEDGYGDYGDEVCLVIECMTCGHKEVVDCMDDPEMPSDD